MAAAPSSNPTLRAHRFIEANRLSPLVYQSSEGEGCVCRLENGETFKLTDADLASIQHIAPRWRHLKGI